MHAFINHHKLDEDVFNIKKPLMSTTWHVGSALKVLMKLRNNYSFVGGQVLRGGGWIYLTRGAYWTSGGE